MKHLLKNEKEKEFIEELDKKLENSKLFYWKLQRAKNFKNNIYLQKDYKIESLLKSTKKEYIIHLYLKLENNKIGESSFAISEDTSLDEFKIELDQSLKLAELSFSNFYTLPSQEDSFVKEEFIDSNIFYEKDFEKSLKEDTLALEYEKIVQNIKRKVEEKSNSKVLLFINYLEIHSNLDEKSLKTSSGIEKEFTKSSAYLEFVITAKDLKTGKESEHIVYEPLNSLLSFNFDQFIDTELIYAQDSLRTSTIKSFTGDVLLTNTAMKDFFVPDLSSNPLIAHLSGKMIYLKMSKLKKGDYITKKAKKDTLTIYSNPLLAHNAKSSPYDGDGISNYKKTLIEQNKVKNFISNKKYADYLSIAPSGSLGVVELENGNKSYEELIKNSSKVIEIVSFSSFSPDAISGSFSAEIRLGYIIENGKRTPFKGGLFSGNVFDLIDDIELSKEIIEKPGYKGPKSIKFYQAEIVGN